MKKIAVTSSGKGLDAMVDGRFGRAPFINVVTVADDGAMTVSTIDNSEAAGGGHGAGIATAEAVANSGADVVLSSHVGPNAWKTLEAAGVKVVIGASGTVKEAVERFLAGEFEFATGPDRAEQH